MHSYISLSLSLDTMRSSLLLLLLLLALTAPLLVATRGLRTIGAIIILTVNVNSKIAATSLTESQLAPELVFRWENARYKNG